MGLWEHSDLYCLGKDLQDNLNSLGESKLYLAVKCPACLCIACKCKHIYTNITKPWYKEYT